MLLLEIGETAVYRQKTDRVIVLLKRKICYCQKQNYYFRKYEELPNNNIKIKNMK